MFENQVFSRKNIVQASRCINHPSIEHECANPYNGTKVLTLAQNNIIRAVYLDLAMLNEYVWSVNEVPMPLINTRGPGEFEPDRRTQPLWTVDEVASYLRLKPETVRVMARNGELPSIKVGRRFWRFRAGEIKDWLKSQHGVVNADKDRSVSSGT